MTVASAWYVDPRRCATGLTRALTTLRVGIDLLREAAFSAAPATFDADTLGTVLDRTTREVEQAAKLHWNVTT
jgi:hypothetical protein